ncbi:hypothetical protein DFJ77DRAFT_440642 [Powellomyces hirtus]|nr:hypothetical protein DFJ77DRAFT_440642 [Powellomyces hirtus]
MIIFHPAHLSRSPRHLLLPTTKPRHVIANPLRHLVAPNSRSSFGLVVQPPVLVEGHVPSPIGMVKSLMPECALSGLGTRQSQDGNAFNAFTSSSRSSSSLASAWVNKPCPVGYAPPVWQLGRTVSLPQTQTSRMRAAMGTESSRPWCVRTVPGGGWPEAMLPEGLLGPVWAWGSLSYVQYWSKAARVRMSFSCKKLSFVFLADFFPSIKSSSKHLRHTTPRQLTAIQDLLAVSSRSSEASSPSTCALKISRGISLPTQGLLFGPSGRHPVGNEPDRTRIQPCSPKSTSKFLDESTTALFTPTYGLPVPISSRQYSVSLSASGMLVLEDGILVHRFIVRSAWAMSVKEFVSSQAKSIPDLPGDGGFES